MQLSKFVKDAGFKILALSRLSSPEYGIVLYMINCSASGMDEISTTYAEIASLMGYSEDRLREALQALSKKNMISVNSSVGSKSLKVRFEFDVHKWRIEHGPRLSAHEALVFPFMPKKVEGVRGGSSKQASLESEPWQIVLNEYVRHLNPVSVDVLTEEKAARLLINTHPVGQVVLMLKHFGNRIKSLSLLASSWQHYQELFESETQKVDFEDARKKHLALDEQLRGLAQEFLSKSDEKSLSEEEVAVLKVIVYHQHPRRQLYWAYQLQERYPNLGRFFADHQGLMLSITSHGTVVKKPKNEKK